MRRALDRRSVARYFELGSASDIFSGETRLIRINERAPSMAQLRGDAVTVDGPTYRDRTRRFALRSVTGFVGITEEVIDGTRLKTRSLDRLVKLSRQGAEEIERVRAMCTPR